VSIGVAQRSAEVRDAVELLRRADFAMYIAKGNDKARYELLDPRMREAVIRR
jgi:PleD family two-component response regulator